MPVELLLPVPALLGGALVLARVAAAVSIVPLPGRPAYPAAARIVLALAVAAVLLPFWPAVDPAGLGPGAAVALLLAEIALGLAVGLAVSLLNEAFVLASQIFGLQAGYGYAAAIDPATQADSSVLQILAHLSAGLLFFAAGLDREVIRAFALSLEALPPGSFAATPALAELLVEAGAVMFSTAVRLALPVVGLLLLVDVSLALLGRINAQLQLLMLAFPAKMLASVALLAAVAGTLPALYAHAARPLVGLLRELAGGAG